MFDFILNFFNPKHLLVQPLSDFQKSLVKNYNKKARNGTLAYEVLPCLCKQQVFKTLLKYGRLGEWSPVVICQKCGLIQCNPRLTEEEYDRFYSSDEYRELYVGETFLKEQENRFVENNHIFDDLASVIKKRGLNTILEVGCGGGWNLIPFKKSGYSVTGFDYSEKSIQQGKSYGLNIRQGSIKSLSEVNDKYDVIILNHVIEHSTNFFNDMNLIRQKMNKNGIIYIGVPNIDNCHLSQFHNAHTLYFTPLTFLHYMNLCGLKEIDFGSAQKIHMYGIFKIMQDSSNQKNGLGNEYTRMIKKIRFEKLKFVIAVPLKILGIKHFVATILKRINILKPPTQI